jgi:predicted DCC family thiol-disulfide oxidoreductase YuxK
VFYDGVCGLCNRTVDVLMRHDRERKLRFAPLQGTTAARLIPMLHADMQSMVFWENGRTWTASDAALQAIRQVHGWPRLALLGAWLPRAWRDAVYAWVARHRYEWFGKKESCRIPAPHERDRLLD